MVMVEIHQLKIDINIINHLVLQTVFVKEEEEEKKARKVSVY